MPTTLINGDILAVRAWCSFDDQAAVNTFNFRISNKTGTGIDDQDAANLFDLYMSAFYPPLIANGARYNGVQVYIINHVGPKPAAVKSIANAADGSGGTNAIPRGASAILKYNTSQRGPAARGRLYIPFIATGAMDPHGEPTSAVNAYFQTFFDATATTFVLGTAPNQVDADWIIYHRAINDYDFIVDGGPAAKFSFFHRRGDYGKPNASPI